jgi:hypothetical protein
MPHRNELQRESNDGSSWSEIDVADLKASIDQGDTLEQTATFLGRAHTPNDVAKKAADLGLTFNARLRGAAPLTQR